MMYKEAAFLILSVFSITLVVAPNPDPCDTKLIKTALPAVNWLRPGNSNNKVGSVKKAADASESYAYCAAALIESRHAEKAKDPKGEIESFSAAQILDALHKDFKSRNIQAALDYCSRGLIKSESVYSRHKGAATLSGEMLEYYCCESFSENEIKRRVSHAPVCVELTVPEDFMKLKTEVYQCQRLKAGQKSVKITVLLYGYDADHYYIKASNGRDWGKNGFAKLKNAAFCGIKNVVSYGVLGASKKFDKRPSCSIQ